MEISYSSGISETPLLGETIGANLRRIARQYPGEPALVDVQQRRRWTYAELDEAVDDLARSLIATGIQRGDRVGIWSGNCPEWVLLQFATARIGAILVCINPAYRSHELAYALKQSAVKLLVSAVRHRDTDYRAILDQACSSVPDLHEVVFIEEASWNAWVAAGTNVEADVLATRAADIDFDDPINIQYTSGTTGAPKGATLTHHNILNNGFFVGEMLGYTHRDRICVPVPFYHCFGMVMGTLAAVSHGATIVIPGPSFDAAATLRAVASERCTSLYGVPTMFIAMLATEEAKTLDLSSLRTGIMAGAPCPVPVMREVIDRLNMREVGISYGMTETSPVSTMTRRDDDLRRRTETVGRVMPHVEVKVVEPGTGRVLPRGTPGELCTRGYSVMRGYWDEPQKTAEAIDVGGWMHTGDLATMDEHGYVAVVGRIKDMIIRGGENIYPREIEEFLFHHPDIADVQVVGVPDAKYGEEVVACIRARAGANPPTPDSLAAFCEGKLARYKIPRYVQIVDEFPMTVTGKIRKVELRQRVIEVLGKGVDLH